MTYTFEMLIEETLQKIHMPLTAVEIWEKAKELHLDSKLGSNGKTPWETVSARIYTEIKKNGSSSKYVQVSKRPAKFYLRNVVENDAISPDAFQHEEIAVSEIKECFKERDLHPLLTKFVYSAPHFKCYTKTVFHEKSQKNKKGKNKWLHPDVVGIYYPFDDYEENTISMISALKENACKLFSFELKIQIDYSNLREYYFQAVSNSSWANEGYLVALRYSDEPSLVDEMRRLNNSFGIGFIKLNAENIEQSEILFTSRFHKSVDWDTINRLVEENKDFAGFVKSVEEDIKLNNVKSDYDEVKEDEEYYAYIEKMGIIRKGP